MRRMFTDAEDAAMAAAVALLEEAGYKQFGRTVSKRINGKDVGGGAFKLRWGKVQRCTVSPNNVFFYCSEDEGHIWQKRTIATGDLEAIKAELKERGAGSGAPPPQRERHYDTYGRRGRY